MERITADVAIVGAGIAGAGLAANLDGLAVVLIEAEERPGHHSTGRSAAIFIQNYGNAAIRALNRASRPQFDAADPEFFPTPLLSERGLLFVASADTAAAIDTLLATSSGLERLAPEAARRMVPLLRPGWLAAAAFEPDARDIDVASLHGGFLRKARRQGTRLLVNAEVRSARREGGIWRIETAAALVEAPVLVDAAGAWADRLAHLCGARPRGLQPMRRSMAVLPLPEGLTVGGWPFVADAAERWYAKPEPGRLFVSASEEDPVEPHDAYPDDMVLAEGLDRFEQAMEFPVTRVERSWAGLRTFAPDRTPVVGFDAEQDGFFWLAGQGGYGIQTAPALSRLAAALVKGETVPDGLGELVPMLSPGRAALASA